MGPRYNAEGDPVWDDTDYSQPDADMTDEEIRDTEYSRDQYEDHPQVGME